VVISEPELRPVPGPGPRDVSVPRPAYGDWAAGEYVADLDATQRLRAALRAGRQQPQPFFDRGPGYAMLAGMTSAEVDWL
jgi:N-methylhydantoinase B